MLVLQALLQTLDPRICEDDKKNEFFSNLLVKNKKPAS
jgi:hypothetical protein